MNENVSIRCELEREGYFVYKCIGTSMKPIIRPNKDVVVIEHRSSERLRKFDAVLFVRPDGTYILHRILKINRNTYWIAGDNCYTGEIVDDSQIIGKMTKIIRNNKEIALDSILYKVYLVLWCAPYHLRFALIYTRRKSIILLKRWKRKVVRWLR